MRTQPHITVVGSSNTDLVVSSERLPKPGETLKGGRLVQFGGGKGANQAVATARAGAKTFFIGAHGEDEFGKKARAALEKDRIDTSCFFPLRKTGSGVAVIFLGGRERQNMILVTESANDKLSPHHVKKSEKAIAASRVVLASLEVPIKSILSAAILAQKHGAKFILNPAPAQKLPPPLLRLTHTIIPNEHEAFLLTGENDLKKAAAKLHRKGCRNVIITLGSRGAYVSDGQDAKIIRSPQVIPVDTVGAGDCFCGWLAFGIAQDDDLFTAATRATKAASISVTRQGAQSGMPYMREVKLSHRR